MAKVKITGHASGSGVVTVTAPNTSTDRTITLPDSTDTLIGSATTDALTTRINGAGGRKNMIINGAMNVAQRGTQSLSSDAYTACDRFQYDMTASYAATYNTTQDSSGTDGFSNSLKFDVTTADTPATDEFGRILYRIEAQDLQHLKYGTSSAQSITLSFWVKSNQAATYAISSFCEDGTRIIGSTYTISSADTWEYKTVTFAGDTAGTIDDNNDTGMQFSFALDVGSFWITADNSSWGSYAGGKIAYGHTATVGRSTSDYFQITGVQLELGSTATDFEHRSYGEELALCQRYYQRITQSAGDYFIMASKGQSSDTTRFAQTLAVPLRASPTISQGGGITSWRCFRGTSAVLTSSSTPSTVGFVENAGFVCLQVAGFSGLTDNYFYGTSPAFSGSGYFDMDSEL